MSIDLSPGWYRLASADEVAAGQTHTSSLLGEELLLFREASGRPRLMEPWCPHLGAHLGHGGRVEGEVLVCPFHGWRIHGEGHVAEVPYSDHKPPRVCLRTWAVAEWGGQLLTLAGSPKAGALPPLEDEGWGDFDEVRWEGGALGSLAALGARLLPRGEAVVEGPGLRLLRGELDGVAVELLLCATTRSTDETELSVLLRVRSQWGWLGDWSARRRARAATTRALSPG